MAAPRGNRFWKLRTKHDTNTLFESPEILLNAAFEYFDWCDRNTWFKHEAIKSGAECGRIIDIPVKRPYSLSGLCVYLGCSKAVFNRFKQKCNPQFKDIIEQIENIIETQQFEGAVTGAFNSSIVVRNLGLREQTDITSNGESIIKIEVLDKKTHQQLKLLQERLKS